MSAECHFYILDRDDPEKSRVLWVQTYGSGWLTLDEPPLVGDLIYLTGKTMGRAEEDNEPMVPIHGMWRVLARCWCPASFGSQAWSTGTTQPEPVWLEVMVEPAESIFSGTHYNT